jgi:hypothetical protein
VLEKVSDVQNEIDERLRKVEAVRREAVMCNENSTEMLLARTLRVPDPARSDIGPFGRMGTFPC